MSTQRSNLLPSRMATPTDSMTQTQDCERGLTGVFRAGLRLLSRPPLLAAVVPSAARQPAPLHAKDGSESATARTP